MTNVEEIYDEIIDEDMTREEKIEAIAECDRLHIEPPMNTTGENRKV